MVFGSTAPQTPSSELGEFEGACDHRRAEITHGQLWDRVPASAWKNVE
ncbi:hypothetical protein FQA91_06535 [Pseudomonas aeruginosa]|nr:hypothetical protein FQA91_06535 [Pseudomonas aeruginosa]HCI4029879.1 hypothetical protein [Pseudomonas aeruginosa]